MTNNLTSWRDWARGLDICDLRTVDKLNQDVIGKLITGEYFDIGFKRNFQRCAFRNAKLTNLRWQRVDYKDTAFVDTDFTSSDLGGGSTVSCTFSNCTFVQCAFEDAAVHDCQYESCVFIDCTFNHSMIRNSELFECKFERCQTSNKLFDGCRLFTNQFEKTKIDFRAIVDNFGLDSRQLPTDLLRDDRTFPQDVVFPIETRISDANWISTLSPLEIVKLQYYLAGGELIGNESIDVAFRSEAWTGLVRAPVNLMRLLQDFSEFILRLFTLDKIPVIFVLKLAILAESIWRGFEDHPSNPQIGQTGAGVYLNCLRWLGDLDTAIATWISNHSLEQLKWRTFDDATDQDISVLADELRRSFPDLNLELRPRNSPVDLVLSGLTNNYAFLLVTLFFCTKTRLELSRLVVSSDKKVTHQTPLVSLSLGGAKGEALHNAISVTSTLPGAMILQLNVDYSVSLVQKIRKTIKGFIS